jgi:hypothetical protein
VDWLFTRPVVVTFAILGAALSMLASALHARGKVNEQRAQQIHYAGYGFMAASMLLFIIAGFRA